MFLISQLIWAFVGIHVFWLYCFITGSLVRRKTVEPDIDHSLTQSRRHYMAELVITSTTGITIVGFVLLLLGFVGLLNIVALLLWLVLEILLFKIIKHENVFGVAFWLSRLNTIKRAWSVPTLIIYSVFLLVAVPGILPPTAWDSISYHLAYAVDWANVGQIYVDEFLRFPYYANNFVLIYALMFVLKLGQLCHFATWLCGLLSGLGIYVLIAEGATAQPNLGRWFRLTTGLKNTVLPLTLVLSPAFMKYVDVGYIDVPIGLFIFIPVLCTYLILNGESRNYEIDLLLTAAFCAGMKVTLFLCLPLFGLSLILVLRRRRKSLSHMLALASLLLLLSAPWYLRNLIVVGDPIPPTLNLMLRGRDPIFTAGDYENLKNDLRTRQASSGVWLLPIKKFWKTDSVALGEPGNNLSVVFRYLPLVTLFMMAFKPFRRRVSPGFIYLNIAVIYLLVNWLGISAVSRYFLHLFPVYLGCLGNYFSLVIGYVQSIAVKRRVVRLAFQTCLLLLLLALPYPGMASKQYYGAHLQRNYLGLFRRLQSREDFLKLYLPGYVSTQRIIDSMNATGNQQQRVLAVGFENLSFYFRERNIVNAGDWFGPARYADLMSAVDNGELAAYLTRFETGAVLVNLSGNPLSAEQYQRFNKQLELSHFRLEPKVEAGTAVYIKTK